MKKIVSILVTILLLSGCSNNKKEELKINLYSNGSTGYQWIYEISNEDIIDISREYQTDCPSDVEGCGGEDVYTITPLKEGKTTIIFKYVRSFEESEDNLEAIYNITIDKELNISETHTGTYFKGK